MSFCVAGAALGAPPERSAEVRRRLSTMGASCFCVAGAALGGPQSDFAGQVQQSYALVLAQPSYPSAHLHITIYTTPSTLHRQHNTICTTSSNNITNTTSSTHHHLHTTIYTTPSTQHHPHNTIYTTSSHTGSCSTWNTAILPLLPHSC